MSLRKVRNLVTATGAAGRDGLGREGNRRSSPIFWLIFIVINLVAKVTGHATATTRNDLHLITSRFERCYTGFVAHQLSPSTLTSTEMKPTSDREALRDASTHRGPRSSTRPRLLAPLKCALGCWGVSGVGDMTKRSESSLFDGIKKWLRQTQQSDYR